jgi:DNA-directed RNA polymerase specialized sigma24 family protein
MLLPRPPHHDVEDSNLSDQVVDHALDTPKWHEADLALVEHLALSGFAGAEFDRFADRLVAHGYRVMARWVASRRIFAECARKGLLLGDPPIQWSPDDQDDLVQDSVATGFRRFHCSALVRRRWHPQGGASLKTYFVGSCVFAFADEYRSWRDRETARRLEAQQAMIYMGVGSVPNNQRFDVTVVESAAALEALHALDDRDPRLARILVLDAAGFSFEEIAIQFADGTTTRAVEGALYRHRRRIGSPGAERNR